MPEEEKVPKDLANTAEQQTAVAECYEWYERDKEAKDDFVKEMDEYDKLRDNEHWDLLGPNGNPLRSKSQQAVRPNAIENYVMSFIEGMISEFSQNVDLVDFPVEASDNTVAEVMTDLKKHIADKNCVAEERLKWLGNYFWNSVGIWETVFDPKWRGGKGPNKWRGDIRWRSVHPRSFFPDARCGSNIQNGRRIHKVQYVPKEYIVEKYPKFGPLAQPDILDNELENRDNTWQAQEDMVLFVETWYIGKSKLGDDKGKGLHVIWWCGESQPIYLDHADCVYYEPDEDCEFPFDVRVRYARDGKWYGWSDAYYLKQPQILHNKTIEILTEGHVHSALGQGFYEPHAMDEKQIKELREKGTLPGMWFPVNDITKVKREYGQSMPASLLQEANRGPQVMERIVGRFDVAQGKAPGSITAFRALDLLNQRAQIRLRKVDVDITRGYEKCGAYINRLIWRNYTERRAYRVIGIKDDKFNLEKREVFDRDKFMKVYDVQSGDVMPANEYTPQEGMVPGEDYEVYEPEMDVRCKTSQAMPSDRLFFMEVAKELYVAQVINDKVFFYVIENGRFPPWSEVAAEMEAYRQQMIASQTGGAPQIPGNAMQRGLPQNVRDSIDAMSPGEAQNLKGKLENLDDAGKAELVALLGKGA